MDRVYRDLARLLRAGEPALLATVVRTFGPAYRREGASAVLTAAGLAAGAISGGCLGGCCKIRRNLLNLQ